MPEDRELFWYAETAAEIWQGIRCLAHASRVSEDLFINER